MQKITLNSGCQSELCLVNKSFLGRQASIVHLDKQMVSYRTWVKRTVCSGYLTLYPHVNQDQGLGELWTGKNLACTTIQGTRFNLLYDNQEHD